MNEHIFREYDIRGKYPEDINEDVAYKIGLSYGSYIKEKYSQRSCVVSMDNRLSSPSLKDNLVKGLLESGCSVLDYGLTTTPMNFYARYLNHLFGIMITASHNPKDDNGFKFSFDHLSNARGEMIQDFKKFTLSGNFLNQKGTYQTSDISDKYIDYMKLGINLGARKRKVIIDCGNGATTIITRKIFEKFNIDFEIINEENDGTFPNHHPDPTVKTNLVQLQKKVLETKADLGIAYDGDGDRVGFVKENGEFMSIEEFMILIIRDISFKVINRKFLYDVKCSKAIEDEILKLKAEPFMYRTGASYTQAKTKEDNLPFGGEFSGHIYFRDKVADMGSAIYASLRMIEILSKTEKSVSELTQNIAKYYATEEIKIPTTDDEKFIIINKITNYCKSQNFPFTDIDGVRVRFKGGWALVRASNTGPNIIFRAEGDSEENKIKLENFSLALINKFKKESNI